jgi:hypothetical protein
MAGNAAANQIEHLRPYIIALMKREGRDFTRCELAPHDIEPGKYEIHHTKYEGATYYDLRIVCKPCNRKAENCLLD